MGASASGSKVCVVCGTEVAGKPRVKSEKGEYACVGDCAAKMMAAAKPAATQAKPEVVVKASAARQPVAAAAAPLPRATPRSTPPADENTGVMNMLLDSSPMIGAQNCPVCQNPISKGSVLCVRCGHNTETGKALKTKVEKVKEAKAPKVKLPKGSGNRWARDTEFGPSFMVLLGVSMLICGGLAAIGVVSPVAWAVTFGVLAVIGLIAHIMTIVSAFMSEQQGWGICGIAVIVPFIGFIPALAFMFYGLVLNPGKWSRSLYTASFLGMLLSYVVLFTVHGGVSAVQGLGGAGAGATP